MSSKYFYHRDDKVVTRAREGTRAFLIVVPILPWKENLAVTQYTQKIGNVKPYELHTTLNLVSIPLWRENSSASAGCALPARRRSSCCQTRRRTLPGDSETRWRTLPGQSETRLRTLASLTSHGRRFR